MSVGAVAERYAQAIFELGREQDQTGPLREQLSAFSSAVERSPELQEALGNPLLPVAQRDAIIRAVSERVGVSALGVRSLLVVAKRNRMGALADIVGRLNQLVDESEGVVRARVVTAAEMPESYFQSLTEQLEATTHKRVVLERSVDPDLIGGAVAHLGDMVLDASVRGRLRDFEQQVLVALAAGAN